VPEQRPRLTRAAEIAGIVGTIATIVGLVFTIYFAERSPSRPVSQTLPTTSAPSPYEAASSPSVTQSPSVQSTPSPSAYSTAAVTPSASTMKPSATISQRTAASTRRWRPPWGFTIALIYAAFCLLGSAILGALCGWRNVKKPFRWLLLFWFAIAVGFVVQTHGDKQMEIGYQLLVAPILIINGLLSLFWFIAADMKTSN